MYNSLSHSELVQVCTVQISFTRNWHKYVQISISQEVGTNVYKSHSHRTPVKICTNLSLSLEIEIVYACPAKLPHAYTPPPPTLVVGRQVLRSAPHIPWDVWVPPPPSPLLPAKPESMVGRWGWGGGGGGDSVAAVGWRSHSLSQQAVTKLYTYHCNIILALGFN